MCVCVCVCRGGGGGGGGAKFIILGGPNSQQAHDVIVMLIPHRNITRLAKRREILIFPRTVGNTGNSRELLVIPGNYWEIGPS